MNGPQAPERTEEQTEPRWYELVIEATSTRERLYIARRDRTRVLRRELDIARAAGKARRHAERLRRRGEAPGG